MITWRDRSRAPGGSTSWPFGEPPADVASRRSAALPGAARSRSDADFVVAFAPLIVQSHAPAAEKGPRNQVASIVVRRMSSPTLPTHKDNDRNRAPFLVFFSYAMLVTAW